MVRDEVLQRNYVVWFTLLPVVDRVCLGIWPRICHWFACFSLSLCLWLNVWALMRRKRRLWSQTAEAYNVLFTTRNILTVIKLIRFVTSGIGTLKSITPLFLHNFYFPLNETAFVPVRKRPSHDTYKIIALFSSCVCVFNTALKSLMGVLYKHFSYTLLKAYHWKQLCSAEIFHFCHLWS